MKALWGRRTSRGAAASESSEEETNHHTKCDLKIKFLVRGDPPDIRRVEVEAQALNSLDALGAFFQRLFPEAIDTASHIRFTHDDEDGDPITITEDSAVCDHVARAVAASSTICFSAIPPNRPTSPREYDLKIKYLAQEPPDIRKMKVMVDGLKNLDVLADCFRRLFHELSDEDTSYIRFVYEGKDGVSTNIDGDVDVCDCVARAIAASSPIIRFSAIPQAPPRKYELMIKYHVHDLPDIRRTKVEAATLNTLVDLTDCFQRLFHDVSDTSRIDFVYEDKDGTSTNIGDNNALCDCVARCVASSSPIICFSAFPPTPSKYELKIKYLVQDPPDIRRTKVEAEALSTLADLSDYFQRLFREVSDTSQIRFMHDDEDGEPITITADVAVRDHVARAVAASSTIRFSAVPAPTTLSPPASPVFAPASGTTTTHISILWDIENCGLRRGDDLIRVHENIMSKIKAATGVDPRRANVRFEAVFSSVYTGNPAYVPIHKSQKNMRDLQDLGIYHVNPGAAKSAADERIKDILHQNIKTHAHHHYYQVLISGDRDFAAVMRAAATSGATVILFHLKNARKAFRAAADVCAVWEDVIRNCGGGKSSPKRSGTTKSCNDSPVSRSPKQDALDFSLKSASMSPNGVAKKQGSPKSKKRGNSWFKRGDRCEARFGKKWYEARIERVHSDGKYDVEYNDGDQRSFVPSNQVRLSFRRGDKCETHYKGKWIKGKVMRVRSDGTYDVQYDDNYKGKGVSRDTLRPLRVNKPNHRRMSDRDECRYYFGDGCNRGDDCSFAHHRRGEYEPTADEVVEYAKSTLGMNPSEESDLLYIARSSLREPLPRHWEYAWNDKGRIYYRDTHSGEWSWEHPSDATAFRLYEKAKKEMLPVNYHDLSIKDLKAITKEREINVAHCREKSELLKTILSQLNKNEKETYVKFLINHADCLNEDPQSAFNYFTRAINLDEDNPLLYLKRSKVALKLETSKFGDQAVEDAKYYNKRCPELIEGVVALGNAYKTRGLLEDAALEFKRAGNIYFKRGELKEAIVKYTMAIQTHSLNATLYSNRSKALLDCNNFLGAIDDAKRCIDIKPGWSKGYYRLGSAYHKKKEFVEAIAAYESGLQKFPGDAGLLDGIARARDEGDDAVEDAKKYVMRYPDEINGYIALGNSQKAIGSLNDAAMEFKKAGNMHYKRQEHKDAVKMYTMAIELCGSEASFYSNRSAALLHCSQFDEAIDDAKQCIDINPSWSKGYSRLGSVYWKKSEFAEAIAAYESGLLQIPDDADLLKEIERARIELKRRPNTFGQANIAARTLLP